MKFVLRINRNNEIYLEKDFSSLLEENIGIVNGDILLIENYEALYLLYKNRAVLLKDNSQLSFNEALTFFSSIDMRCWERFLVYNYFKEKGYHVRRGYNGQFDFLIYEKKGDERTNIATHFVKILYEGKSISMEDFDKILDFSRKMRKGLILAIVDSNGDVTTYEASKIKP